MPTGVVKFYLEEKGYGFIVPDDESVDVFVHHSGISPDTTLTPDERVSYELQAGEDGKKTKAVNISLLPPGSNGPPHERQPPQRDLREGLRERDMPPRGRELRDREPPRDREFGYPPPPGPRDFDERGPPSGFREGDFDRRDSRDFDRRDDIDRRERDFRYPPDNGNRSPPREDRGPPPRRDYGDRGPPSRDGPPRDDRGPPPRREFGSRSPPRGGPPHDDRPPPRRDFGNRSPPRGGPPRGGPGPPRDRPPLPPPPPPHARRPAGFGEGEPRPPPTWSSRVEEAGARPEPRRATNGRLPPGAAATTGHESGRTSRSGSMLGDGDEGALEGVVAEHTEGGSGGGDGGDGGDGSGGGDGGAELSAPLGAALESPADAAGAGGPSDAAAPTEAESDAPARKRARAEPAAARVPNGGGGAAQPSKVRVWLPLQERSVELPAETTLGELLKWGWCIVAPPNGGLPMASASTTEEVEA